MKYTLGYICGSESWGGLEMNHIRNAKWMMDRGHEVFYFCVTESRSYIYASELGLPVISIKKHKKYYDFRQGASLVKLLKKYKITHLLARSTADLSILAYAKYKLKDHLHTSYFMEMQMGVPKKNILHTIRYKYIDVWSCPLNWLKEQVEQMTRFKNKLVVIPSGLELERFSRLNKPAAREKMEIPANSFLFGLAGRFDPQKGQLLLLEAMSLAKEKDFSIVLLGEPTLHESGDNYFQEMNQTIERFELQDRVFIRPFMPDIEVFYAALNWFVMATKAETFGMVTIEALASGIPVLGSNAGGTPEILQNDRFGMLFKPLDAGDMAKKIDKIVSNQLTINKDLLIKAAAKYDHNLVCEAVEKVLNLKTE